MNARYAKRPVHLVFGVFADKDAEPMIRALFPRVAAVTLTPIDNPRSRPPEQYLALAQSLNSNVSVAADAESAVTEAKANAPPNGVVIVAGSLFLVGEVRAALLNRAVILP